MRFLSFLIFLSYPVIGYGYVIGVANTELGISYDDHKYNYGLLAKYKLENKNSNSVTSFFSEAQLGSDEGRSLVATSAHEYQYENSYVTTHLDNDIHFFTPGLLWQTNTTHNLEFQDDGLDVAATQDTDTQFDNTQVNWSISTGPVFEYKRSRWAQLRGQLVVTRISSFDTISDEGKASIGIGKSISPISNVYIDASRICLDYEESGVNDTCRNEISASLSTDRKKSNWQVKFGISEIENRNTDLYFISLNQKLNSHSNIIISSQRTIERVTDLLTQEITSSIETNDVIKEDSTLSLTYQWGRQDFLMRGSSTKIHANDLILKNSNLAIYYKYQLASTLCHACSLGSSFEYYESSDFVKQSISSLVFSKRHNRRFSSSISYRLTDIENQFNTWSINYLISYNGSITKLGRG